MKRLVLLPLATLLLLAGCAPAKDPENSREPEPKTVELTLEQKEMMVGMALGPYLYDPNILTLVSFPENASYTGPDYRLTLCAVYADYTDKRVLVKTEPVSQEARDTFLLYRDHSAQSAQEEDRYATMLGRTPSLHLPGGTDNLNSHDSRKEVTTLGEDFVRYYYIQKESPEQVGYLYFPAELYDFQSNAYIAEIADISLTVDLRSPNTRSLVFDLNLPIGEEGLVADTLTLGVLTTKLTFHAPSSLHEDDSVSLSDTLMNTLADASISWTDQEGSETDLPFFQYYYNSSRTSGDEDGQVQGVCWPMDHEPLPVNQVSSLSINGVSYTPRG